jgi:cystathionine beta-lyase
VDPTPSDLRARGGLKWTFYPQDVLAAWVAEMDFGLAPEVADALHAAVYRGDTGYHYPRLEGTTAQAACGFWEDRFGWKVDSERVFSAPDVVEGIRRAIIHLTPPGSPVVLHTPVYYPFFSMVERAGRELVEVPCHPGPDGRYRFDLDGIARALAAGAGSVVLCNPWNPTGRSFIATELGDLLDVAASHSARVIADEVHAPLTRSETEHVVAASLDPATVVTVTSASKAWNLPGLKCAQVVLTRDRDVDLWSSYFSSDKVGVGSFGLVANAAAYAEGRDWLDAVRSRLDSNRTLLDELIAVHLPAAGYDPPEATYLAWLDFRPYGLDDPAAHLLEHARVALTGGAPFGVGGNGHARINFATPAPILTDMVERMGAAVSDAR